MAYASTKVVPVGLLILYDSKLKPRTTGATSGGLELCVLASFLDHMGSLWSMAGKWFYPVSLLLLGL